MANHTSTNPGPMLLKEMDGRRSSFHKNAEAIEWVEKDDCRDFELRKFQFFDANNVHSDANFFKLNLFYWRYPFRKLTLPSLSF